MKYVTQLSPRSQSIWTWQFRATPVDRALIQRLLDAAVQTTRTMNLPACGFFVVSDAARIDDYARRAKEHLSADPRPLTVRPRVRKMLDDPAFSLFYHASALLVVLAKSDEPRARESCHAAAQTFINAARDARLATCWVDLARPWLELEATKSELGIPPEQHVVAPIVLGYPTTWPSSQGDIAPATYWLPAG